MGKNKKKNKNKNLLSGLPFSLDNLYIGNNNQQNNNTLVSASTYGGSPPKTQQNHNHNMTSLEWYQRRQKNSYWQQRPCVLLFEFCQIHKLPNPKYVLRFSNEKSYYWFDCIVGDRTFNPRRSCNYCWYQNDAIDYIAAQAFNRLFKEYKQKTINTQSIERSNNQQQRDQLIRMDRGTKDVEDKLKSVYMCAECCSKSNLELFHKELNEHKKRKVETMTNHKKVKEDKEKDSIPQLNLLNIGNNSDVNNNPKDVIFMGTFDIASRGQQSKKPTVNLFQTMINNQPNFTIDFGEKTSFVQQQWMQPASGQTAHAQTLPKPIIPLPNVQESQNDHVQFSVPLFTSIQEQASFMQENLMTVPATTDTQEGDKLFNEKRKMISPFRKT